MNSLTFSLSYDSIKSFDYSKNVLAAKSYNFFIHFNILNSLAFFYVSNSIIDNLAVKFLLVFYSKANKLSNSLFLA